MEVYISGSPISDLYFIEVGVLRCGLERKVVNDVPVKYCYVDAVVVDVPLINYITLSFFSLI